MLPARQKQVIRPPPFPMTKKLVQLFAVLFAASMIVAYVVRAQRAQAPQAAPSGQGDSSQPARIRSEPSAVVSSSKSKVPLISQTHRPLASNSPPAVLPGSKSAPVFPAATHSRTAVLPGAKSAGFFPAGTLLQPAPKSATSPPTGTATNAVRRPKSGR